MGFISWLQQMCLVFFDFFLMKSEGTALVFYCVFSDFISFGPKL